MNFIYAMLLTTIAGLSTCIGGALPFLLKKPEKADERVLPVSLGFAAGVMLYLSLTEIYMESKELLAEQAGAAKGSLIAVCCFFIGVFLMGLVDIAVPHHHAPEGGAGENKDFHMLRAHRAGLLRTGIFTAAAISIHNIPEGIIMFLSAIKEPSVALLLVFAVITHNIPVGISVSIPIYYATGRKFPAFMLALLTGLTQPLAALLGYLILMPILHGVVVGALYALVAGIMVFIALDDLLPMAFKHSKGHSATFGLIAGMAVMAASIYLLE